MSSGIGLSLTPGLQTAFNTLVKDSQLRALIAHIDNETIDHSESVQAVSDHESDFDHLSKYLKPDEPRYIIYKIDSKDGGDAAPSYVFILFVPDIAKVRSKMLYASGSNAFQRQLGGAGLFSGGTIYWTTIEEVSSKGWKDHQAHEALAAPLTTEEQSLRDVREKEADQMLGTAATKSHVPSHASASATSVPMKFSEKAVSALESLARSGSVGAVSLKILLPEEVVEVTNESSSSQLAASFFETKEAQYVFYKGEDEKVFFFYICPSGTPVKQRMVHATSVKSVIAKGEEVGLKVSSRLEGDDGEELVQEWQEAVAKQGAGPDNGASRQRFSRPKAPGRRRNAA